MTTRATMMLNAIARMSTLYMRVCAWVPTRSTRLCSRLRRCASRRQVVVLTGSTYRSVRLACIDDPNYGRAIAGAGRESSPMASCASVSSCSINFTDRSRIFIDWVWSVSSLMAWLR